MDTSRDLHEIPLDHFEQAHYKEYHEIFRDIIDFIRVNEEDDYSDHKGYLKYVIGEKTYYIKHFNKLWVVSDFEYMGKKGEILETSGKGFNTNFFKKIFCELYDKIKEPIKGCWLYDLYVLTYFIGAYTMSERVFNLYNEGCTLNPIDAIHFIIKNEISHIFICENL
jgi:hypothetical protein